ncbi:MAG: O-antigen ligase family protein [Clostridia bacterium]|nr:O-antigen ligase family protein [Clostridia bacterium]
MCFISLYWIIDFFTFHYGFLSLEWEFVTPWCNPNHSGYMLAISIMLSAGMFLFDNHKIAQSLGLAGFCLLIITLGFNNTFGCQLSTLVAMICLSIACLLREKKNYLQLLILWTGYIGSMAIISAILEHNQFGISSYWQNFKGLFKDVFLITSNNANANTAGTNRWGLWKECFRNIREHPIFGIGINCQRIDNPLIESGRPHNELLQFTSTMGLPAGIFYLLAIIFTGIISIKQIKKIDAYSLICLFGAMGYFLSSFFGVSLTYTFPYFLIFLALGLNGIDHKKPSQNNCLSNKNIIQ